MSRHGDGPSLRAALREVMEPYAGGPESTWLSLAVDLVVLVCILASCALVVLEWVYPSKSTVFHPIEIAFTVVFIIEYLLRWYSSENRWTYPFTPMAILDLLAILPTVLMLSSDMLMLRMVRGARMFRLLRLLRLVRLLRLLRYGPLIYRALLLARVWLSSITFQYRLHQLGKLFLWALATLFVGANVLHITEIAFDGEAGPFGGYWRSYWNILIVLVSGIEDKEPISLLGRIEVTLLLIAGIVIVGMLTGEIVSILIRRVQRAGKVALKPPSGRFERHVVILGNNGHIDAVIRQVNTALHGLHHILVVHPDADQLPITAARAYRRVFALPGEPRDTRTLEAADIDRAARVIVLAPPAEQCDSSEPDNRALMATVAVVCRKASIPLVVELTDERNLRYTHGLPEVDFVVGRAFGERMISQAVLNPGITEVYDHLLNFSGDSNELYTMPVPKRLVGKTFSDAQLHFLDRDEEAITLVGIDRSPRGNPNSVFTLCPQAPEADAGEDELVLDSNDRLVLLAYHRPTTMGPDTEDRWSPTRLARE